MKLFLKKNKHVLLAALYLPFYLMWFHYLEKTVQKDYHIIHCSLDSIIPFQEIFIIPYLLWFGLVVAMFLYLGFTNKQDFRQFVLFLFSGMTLYLIICTMFPNGQNMRPVIDPDKNVLTRLISMLWTVDTSTNVFPSIHAYNSIAVAIAAIRNEPLSRKPALLFGIIILCISICLSTVFLKQHSVLDVLGAIIMAMLFYRIFYVSPSQEQLHVAGNHA